jgi:hypothetical protein
MLSWARQQLTIASEIIDNPGGGLLFATQTMGQVGAALDEDGGGRWGPVVDLVQRAEDLGVRRQFAQARALLGEAQARLRSDQ